MIDFRCSNCNRMLAKVDNELTRFDPLLLLDERSKKEISSDKKTIEIKCPRCNEMNTI